MTEHDDKISRIDPARQRSLEQAAKQALDKSLDDLANHISEQLLAARKKALSQAEAKPTANKSLIWGMAASMLIAGTLWLFQADKIGQQPAEIPLAVQTIDKAGGMLVVMEMAEMDDQDLALVEDLEFMYWLSLQNDQDV